LALGPRVVWILFFVRSKSPLFNQGCWRQAKMKQQFCIAPDDKPKWNSNFVWAPTTSQNETANFFCTWRQTKMKQQFFLALTTSQNETAIFFAPDDKPKWNSNFFFLHRRQAKMKQQFFFAPDDKPKWNSNFFCTPSLIKKWRLGRWCDSDVYSPPGNPGSHMLEFWHVKFLQPCGTKWDQVRIQAFCFEFWHVMFLQPCGTKWHQMDPNQDPSPFAWNSGTSCFYNHVDPSGSESGSKPVAWNSGTSCFYNHVEPSGTKSGSKPFAWNSGTSCFYNHVDPSGSEWIRIRIQALLLGIMARYVFTTMWIQVDPNQDPSPFAWNSGKEHLEPDSYYNTN